jgi:hypothetical protein
VGSAWTDRVVIAASDSPSDWQAQAAEICTGTNDEAVINAQLISGTMVELAPGTFNCAGYLTPPSRTRLSGQGETTVVNLVAAGVLVDADHVEFDHLRLAGTVGAGVPVAIFISAQSQDRSDIRVHDVTAAVAGGDEFAVYANAHDTPNRTVSKVSFVRCAAPSPDGFGFVINGEGTTPRVQDLTFYQCSVDNAGVAATRTGPWVTGIGW